MWQCGNCPWRPFVGISRKDAKKISMLRMHRRSLRFVRRDDMEAGGYRAYLDQVEDIDEN